MVTRIATSPTPVETLKVYKTPACSTRPASVQVDIVSRAGRDWVKVIARNAQALHREWKGIYNTWKRILATPHRYKKNFQNRTIFAVNVLNM